MATIRKRKSGKWQVIIRKKNYPFVVRSFLEKSTASKFAKDVETQMDKQIFKDLSGASTTTLKDLMIKYRDEIVPNQKSHMTQCELDSASGEEEQRRIAHSNALKFIER